MSNYGVPDNNNDNGMLPYHQTVGVSGGQQPYYSQTNNAQYQQTSYVQNYNMMPPQQQIVYNQPGNLQAYNQYQQYQSNGQSNVQQQQPVYYQQQIPQYNSQQQQYNQQYPHQQQYANYKNAAAPQPPPPPVQNTHYNNTHNTNANVAASLRQSLSSTTSNNNNNNNKPETKSKKKVNPKMAKKYSGRGLKTITIAGPGMPTQRFKICVGNHPDDIKKWIEERKKRFPRRDGSHKKCNTSSSSAVAGMKRSRLDDEKDNDDENGKRPCIDKSTVKSDVAESKSEAGGLSSLLAGYGSSSSEDEDESNNLSPTGKVDTTTTQEEGEAKQSTATETKNTSPPKRLCTYYQRGKCRHGTTCKFLHSDKPINNTTQNNNKRQSQSERDKARNQYEQELKILGLATPSHGSRYTSGGKVINNTSLLHQLLARDKERERSLTLQLLRYIVDCDYFQNDRNNASTRQSDDNDDNEQSGGEDDKDTAKEPTLK